MSHTAVTVNSCLLEVDFDFEKEDWSVGIGDSVIVTHISLVSGSLLELLDGPEKIMDRITQDCWDSLQGPSEPTHEERKRGGE